MFSGYDIVQAENEDDGDLESGETLSDVTDTKIPFQIHLMVKSQKRNWWKAEKMLKKQFLIYNNLFVETY